ncbi:hypothetical protein AB2888_11615 [Escherichia coli]|nr:hypothetical protein [Escherichia coli]
MSQINVTTNEKQTNHRQPYNRDYCWLLSEDSNDRLEKVIDITGMVETLLDAKAEMKVDNMILAKQMGSLFSILYGELKSIKADLYEPGGIFSQNDIQGGLEYIRGSRTENN